MFNLILALVAGAAVGSLLVWLALRSQSAALHERVSEFQRQGIAAQADLTSLRAESLKTATAAAQMEGELKELRPALTIAKSDATSERELRTRAETQFAGAIAYPPARRRGAQPV